MYSRVCLLCIIVTLSLGHVASKAGVEENDKIFSLNFEVINPRDRNCELMGNTSKCEVDLSVDSTGIENIDNGIRFLIAIQIGKQIFRVQLDTGSNLLWVIADLCKKCDKHATKYVLDQKKLAGYKRFMFNYIGGGVGGFLVEDTVQVTKNIVIKKQLVGAACIVNIPFKGFDGVMGLNLDTTDGHLSVFLSMLHDKLIKEPIYSIYLLGGRSSKNGGMITFGGHNDNLLVEDSGVKAPMVPTHGQIMTSMTSLNIGKEVFCSDEIKTCKVNVDSGGSQILGPKEFVVMMDEILEPKKNNEVDCKKVDVAPTIEIFFGKQKMTLEPKFYMEKYVNGKCYSSIFKNPTKEFDWQFGIPFFVKYYIEFDFTEKEESICFWTKK